MAYPYYPNYSAWNPNGQMQMPLQGSQMPPVASPAPQMTNDINWVQGEADAKSRPVAAGHSVILMDTEESVMYIKTVDQSGMPQPLRIFDYVERSTQQKVSEVAKPASDMVTREEFNALAQKVDQIIKGEGEG